MFKFTYIAFLLLFTMASCKTQVKPMDVITDLKGVSEIQILLLNDSGVLEVKKVLTSESDIEYFQSTFKPSKSKGKSQIMMNEEGFIKDGEIQFILEGGEKPLVVDYDLDKGYRIELSQKNYYEQFTYRTGRYLAESLSAL